MNCRRCPHHVRHGLMAKDGKTIQFKDHCGLKLKRLQEQEPLPKKTKGKTSAAELRQKQVLVTKNSECIHFPFEKNFDYFSCAVYQKTFATQGLKNSVLPTKDIHFSESISGGSLTDLDFL